MLMTFRAFMLMAACCLGPISQAHASDDYPSRPVKIIVPFAAAGPTDIVARLVGKGLSENLKQSFFVENLPGAGGNLGTAAAAKSAPDGYTMVFVASSFVVNPTLYARIPFDAQKDLDPVMMVGDGPNMLIVNPSLPVSNVKEFVALMKAHPGEYTFASAGVGTTTHLSGELMKLSLGLELTHVPFAGSGPVMQSLVGGHTPIAFTTIPPALSLIKEGKVRALAVLAKTRSSALPDVPTMEEAGYPGQEGNNFQGLLVPAGTPKPIIDKLRDQVASIVQTPESVKRFEALGLDVVANTPKEFAGQIDAEILKWGKIVKAAKLRIE
jgi:tripartite-type tricarboxylate transporter receptor subunit TctC